MHTRLFFYTNVSLQSVVRYLPKEHELLGPRDISLALANEHLATITIDLAVPAAFRLQLIPCFSCTSAYDFEYLVTCRVADIGDRQSANIALVSVGRSRFNSALPGPSLTEDEILRADIDVFITNRPVRRLYLTFHISSSNAAELLAKPFLVSLSINSLDDVPPEPLELLPVAIGKVMSIPTKSQMEAEPDIRRRICSPTCTSMVIDSFGSQTSLEEIAGLTYNKKADMYGIWAANVLAASKYGLLGYIFRFTDWQSVASLLTAGVPIVASINYVAGELTNAAIESTTGHLVVIKGLSESFVVVNDPASIDKDAIERNYAAKEFNEIWLRRKGVGYMLFNVPEISPIDVSGSVR